MKVSVKRENDRREKTELREKLTIVSDMVQVTLMIADILIIGTEGDLKGKVEHYASRVDFSIMDSGFRTYRCTKPCPKAE